MKLIILESNKDKKGSILEGIVKTLLINMGFRDVVTNEVESGGSEIDVVAKKNTSGDATCDELIICECKAHQNPITMTDWLKFIGKHAKEKRSYDNVLGIMIALSDANGNVKGDVRQSQYKDIKLISGEDLIDQIICTYKMKDLSSVRRKIDSCSTKVISEINIAFFDNSPFWVISFIDGCFTFLDKDSQFVSQNILGTIAEEFTKISTFSLDCFVDLQREIYMRIKKTAIETVALWLIMSGPKTVSDIVEGVNNYSDTLNVDPQEVEILVSKLDFFTRNNDRYEYKNNSDIDKISLYSKLLSLGIPTKYYSDFYINNIDNNLLNKILKIQGGLQLTEEESDIVLFMLKHSPSALRYALTKQGILNPRVNVENADQDALRMSINSTFIQTLSYCLEVDADSDIAMLLFDKFELRDFNKHIQYDIVLKDGTHKVIPVSKRLYYIPFEDSGGAVIQASNNFIGEYDPQTGIMVSYKRKNQSQKQLFGVVKHKTGESGEEYLSLYH